MWFQAQLEKDKTSSSSTRYKH